MIKEMFICLALFDMNGVVNEKNICENIETLSHISKEYNIDTYTYVSMLWIESNFNKEIVSYTGKACGISQVVPKWTRPKKSCKDLNSDIKSAMIQGARIFKGFKRYGGKSLDISLCGYNQGYRCKGEKEVKKGGYDYRKEGLIYAKKVKSFRKKLKYNVRKQKRKVNLYKKKLERALRLFYRL
jgi:soluble lytic murein transglycosylase-like protein